jgi:hypothetical protein
LVHTDFSVAAGLRSRKTQSLTSQMSRGNSRCKGMNGLLCSNYSHAAT